MQIHRAFLSVTVALGMGLGMGVSLDVPASAQAQIAANKTTFNVAQSTNRAIQTLPDVGGVRFRALAYQTAATKPAPALEQAIARELSGDVANVRYLYNSIDLDGDGRNEAIAYLVGSSTCGSGGCTMLIFKATGTGSYKLISRHTIVNNPIVVSDQKTKGWRDLVLYVAGGGAKPSYHRLKFNGSTYPSNPSTAPTVPQGTIVTGTAVIADQISPGVGLPLGRQR